MVEKQNTHPAHYKVMLQVRCLRTNTQESPQQFMRVCVRNCAYALQRPCALSQEPSLRWLWVTHVFLNRLSSNTHEQENCHLCPTSSAPFSRATIWLCCCCWGHTWLSLSKVNSVFVGQTDSLNDSVWPITGRTGWSKPPCTELLLISSKVML